MKPYIHKVNYYETDKMAITHHSNYIRFMEEARVDFLEQLGWPFDRLEKEGIVSPVMGLECRYLKTTTFADSISILVKVSRLSSCKMSFSYEFKCNDAVVFTAESSHCFLGTDGRPVMLDRKYPDFFRELKASMES